VTLMYGKLGQDGTLTYCNAGHNPPLIVSKSDVRRLETGGPIVGLFEHAPFDEETIRLAPDECLVIYSDGISEALNAAGDEFGEARIVDTVRRVLGREPQTILEQLFAGVRDFSKGAPQGDDITGMIVTYNNH
jgi:phosphoserine phosphatase RsbU/P